MGKGTVLPKEDNQLDVPASLNTWEVGEKVAMDMSKKPLFDQDAPTRVPTVIPAACGAQIGRPRVAHDAADRSEQHVSLHPDISQAKSTSAPLGPHKGPREQRKQSYGGPQTLVGVGGDAQQVGFTSGSRAGVTNRSCKTGHCGLTVGACCKVSWSRRPRFAPWHHTVPYIL